MKNGSQYIPHIAKRFLLVISVLIITALIIRLIYFFSYLHSPLYGFYRNDHLYYREWGLQIAAGNWLGNRVFDQGPLYGYLLGVFYYLFGPVDIPIIIFQLLCDLVTMALIVWCANHLWGKKAAVISGALAALYGPLIFYSCMIMKNFLEPLLIIAALAAVIRGLKNGRLRWYAMAGLAIGLACLVREVHGLLLVPILFSLGLLKDTPRLNSHRLKLAAITLLAFFIPLMPALLRNWVVARQLVIVSSAAGQNMYIAFGPNANGFNVSPEFAGSGPYQESEDFREEAFFRTGRRMTQGESSRFWLLESARWIRSAPMRTLTLLASKMRILFNDYEAPDSENFYVTRSYLPVLRFLPTFGWIVGLGFFGIMASFNRYKLAWLPIGFAATLILEVLLTFNLGRYRLSLASIWLLFSGVGVTWITSAGFWRKTPAKGVIIIAVAILVSIMTFSELIHMNSACITAEYDLFKRRVEEAASYRKNIPKLKQELLYRQQDPKILNELGLAMEKTGRLSEAIAAYEEVLRIAPKFVMPRFKLADIYLTIGNREQAARHARFLVKINPMDDVFYVLLGKILVQQARYADSNSSTQDLLEKAKINFAKALEINLKNYEAHYWLGKIFFLNGRRQEAIVEFNALRNLAPNSKETVHLIRLMGMPKGPFFRNE